MQGNANLSRDFLPTRHVMRLNCSTSRSSPKVFPFLHVSDAWSKDLNLSDICLTLDLNAAPTKDDASNMDQIEGQRPSIDLIRNVPRV